MRKSKGITLIALVITIIILIILAGVAINLTLGDNGIFNKTKLVKEKELEGAAREKLELVLVEANIEKQSNTSYNKEEFLNEMLEKNGITVNADTVIVDNYVYEIDREKLKIGQSLGKTSITVTTIVKSFLGLNANNKYEVNKLVKVESNNEIESVRLKKSDDTDIELTVEEITAGKEITMELDEEYQIIIETKDGKIENRVIVEKTEENIRTAEELADFRDKVNTGLTYEGKKINVVEDLNLASVCGKNIEGKEVSWEPIGNYGVDETHIFKGTFDGKNHIIDKLYINSEYNYQGLFGYVKNATITGVIIGENSEITGNILVGGIVGKLELSTISNTGNNATVKAYKEAGGIAGTTINSNIIGSYNKGNIISEDSYAGGIVAYTGISTILNKIEYSYNTGVISGANCVGGISGYSCDYTRINNCYNKGDVNADTVTNSGIYMGGITGFLRAYTEVNYSYNIGTITNDSTGIYTGGIAGANSATDGTSHYAERASKVQYSYNSGNIVSKGKYAGGIVGRNYQYCIVKNNYNSNGASVKYNSTAATNNIGSSSSNYIGKIIGCADSTSTTYVDGNGMLTQMPTVYNVVNGLNDGESQYWSNNNLNEPKLKWEK